MRTRTYFRAYQMASFWCKHYERIRGSDQGIAVQDDYYAKLWQREARKARKFEQRILQRLEREP